MNGKLLLLAACIIFTSTRKVNAQGIQTDKTTAELKIELNAKDSLIFEIAFKSCEVDRLTEIYAKDFVMLYDGGFNRPTTQQSFADFEQRLRNSCKNKSTKPQSSMRRIVSPGSMQVFLLTANSAIQTGVQQFFMKQPGSQEIMVEESKFTRCWTKTKAGWRISTETDFLVNNNPQATLQEHYKPAPYVPASKELYNTIVKMDSIYFDTYNHCKLDLMDSLTAEDIEFYHDRGGLSTSKMQLLESIKKNICGKVTRILTKNSIEVYEIPNYGAVEFGYHSFRNIAEQGESLPSKFVTLWRKKEGKWQITRVISLH